MMRFYLSILLLVSCMLYGQEPAIEPPVIWVGMDREALIDMLGHPESTASTDTRTIFLYKDGVRFELELDVVVSVQGYKGRIEFSEPGHPPRSSVKAMEAAPAKAVSIAPHSSPARQDLPRVGGEAKPAPAMPTLAGLERKAPIPGEKSATPYRAVTAPAMNTFVRLADFFRLVYDPQFLDAEKHWVPPATLVLACMLRIFVTMLAFRFAGRRCDRELLWNEYVVFSSLDFGFRLALSGLEDWLFPGQIPALVCEAIVAGLLFLIVWRRADRPGWWMSLRIVLIAKAAVLVASFALFLLLLNLSVE